MAEKIIGLKELQKKLALLGPAVGGTALRNATRAAMKPVADQAIVNAPVGKKFHRTYKGNPAFPGYLRRNIVQRARLSKDKQTSTSVVGVKAEAYYGLLFVELGTSRARKRPWLEPAMTSNLETTKKVLKEKLKLEIDKVRKR